MDNERFTFSDLTFLIGQMQALLYTAHSHFNSKELKLYEEINEKINSYFFEKINSDFYKDKEDGS